MKTKGHNPIKLLTAKVINSATPANLTELPATLPFTRPISSESPFAKEETPHKLRLETTQEEDGIKQTATHLIQLIFTPIPVLGSKVLNNLLILLVIINYQVFRVLKFKILYDNTPWYACRSMQLKE